MKASKMTIAMMFAATMAWANVASADEPCGAPVDTFQSCEVIEAPHCYDACGPEAMVAACVADNSDQCLTECTAPGSVSCPAACDQQCGSLCTAEIIRDAPYECVVSCGASCMGDCAAGCAAREDKATCYAECNQDCSASCQISCSVQNSPKLDIDYGVDEGQERFSRGFTDPWRDYFDSCKKRHKRDFQRFCKDRRSWWKDYEKRCRTRFGAHWRKFCPNRAHFGRFGYFELGDYLELTQEQLAEAGINDIASQCQTGCQQSCSGVCEASSVLMCERECQAQITSVCAPQMTSSCSEECSTGAVLMCDGQYLHVRDVDACVAALEHGGVTVEGSVSALKARELVTDALQGASCSVEEPSKRGLVGSLLALLGLGLGAGALRRRRS